MNFEYLPEIHWRYSYPIFWIGNLLIITAIALFFREKRWL